MRTFKKDKFDLATVSVILIGVALGSVFYSDNKWIVFIFLILAFIVTNIVFREINDNWRRKK